MEIHIEVFILLHFFYLRQSLKSFFSYEHQTLQFYTSLYSKGVFLFKESYFYINHNEIYYISLLKNMLKPVFVWFMER